MLRQQTLSLGYLSNSRSRKEVIVGRFDRKGLHQLQNCFVADEDLLLTSFLVRELLIHFCYTCVLTLGYMLIGCVIGYIHALQVLLPSSVTSVNTMCNGKDTRRDVKVSQRGRGLW